MFYLLADSTALFKPSSLCLPHLSKQLGPKPKIAYVGASNGDVEEYFQLFCAAMEPLRPQRLTHVRCPFEDQALRLLADSDLLVLAGGDVEAGWSKFADPRFQSACAELFSRSICWMGVSAGAVQLGAGFFGVLPWYIGAHEEANAWRETIAGYHRLEFTATQIKCLGLNSGAAVFINEQFDIELLAGHIDWLDPDSTEALHGTH